MFHSGTFKSKYGADLAGALPDAARAEAVMTISLTGRIATALRRFSSLTSGPSAGFAGGSGCAVAHIDKDGLIVSDAPSFRRLFLRGDEARSLLDAFLPEERSRIDEALKSNRVDTIEVRARRRADGDIGVFELTFDRRAYGRICVLMVDRTRHVEELAQLRREAERARGEAREGVRALGDLSHEMRTPLNAVIGFADAMTQETFGPLGHEKYEEYAEHIRASGRHLLDLVSAILDLARIEADRFTLSRAMVEPGKIALSCADMLRLSAEKAGLRLTTHIEPNLPACWMDARALRQILINLLSNAIKFTSDGEITLTVGRDEDAIVFAVSDNGIGMSEAELERIGARFTSAQINGVRGAGGAGLGLSLAQALAELHGGALSLQSAPGEGLRAEVRLPISAEAAPARESRRAPAIGTRSATPEDLEGAELAKGNANSSGDVLTQLERVEAYRRDAAARRKDRRASAA